MTNLKPGDRVVCRIRNSEIVGPYSQDYEYTKTFEIVGTDDLGYYIYVPPYLYLRGVLRIDNYNYKRLNINKKYIGDDVLYIIEGLIAGVDMILDGKSCNKCHEFCSKAVANQADGSFLCWSCRNNMYR